MLIKSSKLINLPVIDPESHERLGEVCCCVFEPDRGRLLALKIKTGPIAAPVFYVSFMDIKSFENHAVLASEDTLTELADYPKVKEVCKSGRLILRQSVIDETKHGVGTVADVIFNDATGDIFQIETHHLISKRLINYHDVIEVTKKAVLIRGSEIRSQTKIIAESSVN